MLSVGAIMDCLFSASFFITENDSYEEMEEGVTFTIGMLQFYYMIL